MPNLLSDVLNKSEKPKGPKFYIFVALLLLACLFIGIGIGNITNKFLNNNEDQTYTNDMDNQDQINDGNHLEGKVVYVDPKLYPLDNISYALVDDNNNQIALLSAKDQKLLVVEGLHVNVYGTMKKSTDGKQNIFEVEKVIARNK